MHNTYPQLGRYSKQLGCIVYDEGDEESQPQMGGLGSFDVGSAISDAIKKVLPGVSNQVVQKFLVSDDGKQLSTKLENTAYAVGAEQAAAQAAQELAARESYFKSQIKSLQSNLQANWQKYLMWSGIAVAGVVAIMVVMKMVKSKPLAAANPRRKRLKVRKYRRRK